MDTMIFVIHAALWTLGFIFLLRIPLYRTARKDGPPSHLPTSVIIPARNEETVLPNLLASLREQSYIPDEIIVVDDQSEDRTKEVAEGKGMISFRMYPHGFRQLVNGWSRGFARGAAQIAIPLLFFLIVFGHSLTLIFMRRRFGWKERTIDLRGKASG